MPPKQKKKLSIGTSCHRIASFLVFANGSLQYHLPETLTMIFNHLQAFRRKAVKHVGTSTGMKPKDAKSSQQNILIIVSVSAMNAERRKAESPGVMQLFRLLNFPAYDRSTVDIRVQSTMLLQLPRVQALHVQHIRSRKNPKTKPKDVP